MAKINYKGKEVDIALTNRSLMQFEMSGGNLNGFESQPISSSILLACACLKLDGDPLDHADDLPPLAELAEAMKVVVEESGLTGEIEEKNEDG